MNRLSAIVRSVPELIVAATLEVETPGEGFVEITSDTAEFVRAAGAGDGILLFYIRHTSASLTIQENADADVLTDLGTALRRLAPADSTWVHEVEGPDDMPAHIRTMLTGVSLHVPVVAGALALGTWQGIYAATLDVSQFPFTPRSRMHAMRIPLPKSRAATSRRPRPISAPRSSSSNQRKNRALHGLRQVPHVEHGLHESSVASLILDGFPLTRGASLSEGRWYGGKDFPVSDAHPLEVDLMLLALLKVGRSIRPAACGVELQDLVPQRARQFGLHHRQGIGAKRAWRARRYRR